MSAQNAAVGIPMPTVIKYVHVEMVSKTWGEGRTWGNSRGILLSLWNTALSISHNIMCMCVSMCVYVGTGN